MDVSVVIPTYNRAALLARTIPALMSQEGRDFTYEVIFVSNGSTDSTPAVLGEAAARYPDKLRFFAIAPTGGPSAPRNVGIRAARGDAVVILDDDVLPDPSLVQEHALFHRAHPEPHSAAVGELYVPRDMAGDPMSYFHMFPYEELRGRDRLSYLHFWTCNVSVKRRFMLDQGMFDEAFLFFEDVLCGHQLARAGMHLRFVPAARGQHLHQIKPAGVPAKGEFIGRWLHRFVEVLPEREVKERFGILTPEIGAWTLSKRLVRRLGFRVLDNPATAAGLRLLGGTGPRRSWASDLYYFLVLRRNMLAGYYAAKEEARDKAELRARGLKAEAWLDRGEP